jgi:hypothetical protein
MAAEHPPEPAPITATSYGLCSRACAVSGTAKKINELKITAKIIVLLKDQTSIFLPLVMMFDTAALFNIIIYTDRRAGRFVASII